MTHIAGTAGRTPSATAPDPGPSSGTQLCFLPRTSPLQVFFSVLWDPVSSLRCSGQEPSGEISALPAPLCPHRALSRAGLWAGRCRLGSGVWEADTEVLGIYFLGVAISALPEVDRPAVPGRLDSTSAYPFSVLDCSTHHPGTLRVAVDKDTSNAHLHTSRAILLGGQDLDLDVQKN